MSKSVAEILNGAADVLEQVGWIQGGMYDEEGHVCALGAMAKIVHEESDEYWAARNVLSMYLHDSVAQWNDAPERTEEEVVKTLREVAAHVDA